MRVLHIGKYYPPHRGGMESHLEALCAELCKSMEVRVLVAGGRKREDEQLGNVRVTRLRTHMTLAATPFCLEMAAEIRKASADLVHVHWPNPAAVLAYLRSGHSGPLIVTYHSDVIRQKVLGAMFDPILHRFLRKSDAILTTSPQYSQSSRVLQQHMDKCHVVPLGSNFQDPSSTDRILIDEIRSRFGPRLLLAVGRHVYYKGFRYLVEAMRDIDARLLMIGDGPLRTSLEDLTRRLGIAHKIAFLGEVEDVAPYYNACDVFVMPSIARSEAFGIVQIEAMNAGKPVVNTSLDSGVPFVSLHDVTGVTVPPADARALAAGINRLLANPSLREEYGRAAQVRARTLFSVQTMASRTRLIYEAVLDSAASAPVAMEAAAN